MLLSLFKTPWFPRLLLAPWTLALVSCVTINIYFPAAAAEKAAELIVEDVLSGSRPSEPAPPQGDKSGQLTPAREIIAAFLDWAVPPAAAATKFDVDTPAIREIQSRMKSRHGRLRAFYDAGAIGYTRQGLIAVRDAASVPLKSRSKLNALVKEENRDRNALYREIAKANGHPEWEPEVRAVFAQQWIDKAQRGWWYQDAQNRWRQ
ncbi:MAG: YdbL family protein [Pseudomonadota bacterium]